MNGIPQTIADELLPLIFRRRRQPMVSTPPFVGENMLAPSQDPAPPTIVSSQTPKPTMAEEAISRAVPVDEGQNVLVPKPPPLSAPLWDRQGNPINRGDLPATTLDEKTMAPMQASQGMMPSPQTTPSPEPMMSRSGQSMDETAMRGARRVETDKRGRPTPNIALQGDDQALDYQDRLARMPEDTEGGGWWPKIAAALAGFAAGGPVGAAAGFGTRALREHFDPTLGSREYKRQKMGQNAPAVEQIRQSRKDSLDEESKRANTDLAKARTDALKNPHKNGRIVERKDGVYMIDPTTGKAEKIAGIPAEAGTPGSTRYISRADGVYGINTEHPNGFKVSGIPGNAGKDVEDVTFGNAQIQRAISDAEQEQQKIDKFIDKVPLTINSTDIMGNPRVVPNPEYTYNMTRRRQLDDDIRNWRLKLKSSKKGAATSTKTSDPLGILDDEEDNEP